MPKKPSKKKLEKIKKGDADLDLQKKREKHYTLLIELLTGLIEILDKCIKPKSKYVPPCIFVDKIYFKGVPLRFYGDEGA